ncbi:MAG: hypothetical protein K0R08_1895 [Solimicrobium sp.]|nr:hypothetical protein [Solimicrobium sp.]
MISFFQSFPTHWEAGTSETSSFCQNQLVDIKKQAKNQAYAALANSLKDLVGGEGYTEITVYSKNPQIHLFFKTQTERSSFQLRLSEEFSQYSGAMLEFEDWQTQSENNLFSLKLKAHQSVALLGKNPLSMGDFSDGRHILFETKKHLEFTFLVPDDKNTDIIKNICSWLPLNSLSNYARTCQGTFNFVMNNDDLWRLFAISEKINLADNGIQHKLQVMGNAALKEAQLFESAHAEQSSRLSDQNNANFESAIKSYIAAARLGSGDAIAWLSSVDKSEGPAYGHGAIIAFALGEIFSEKNANPEFGNPELESQYYEEGLKELAELAIFWPELVFEDSYTHCLGEKSIKVINDSLQNILSKKIQAASSNNVQAGKWLCDLFSDTKSLSPLHKAKTEEAMSAAIKCSEFLDDHRNVIGVSSVFRNDYATYSTVRDIIELKLNNLLKLEPPIQLHFAVNSSNRDQVVIFPESKNDSDRFKEAVLKSELAQFFSESSFLDRGNHCKGRLEFTKDSWDQFKTVILSVDADPTHRTSIRNAADSQRLPTVSHQKDEIKDDESPFYKKKGNTNENDNCVTM